MPRKLAVKAGPPPTLIVEYDHHSDGVRTDILRRKKTIRLHKLATCADSAESVAQGLAQKFPRHLGPKVVRQEQLAGLILKLQDRLGTEESAKDATTISGCCGPADKRDTSDERQGQNEHNTDGDLNRASEDDLAAAKMRMNAIFEKNAKKPGSAGYVHDVRRDFDGPEEECEWDEDSC